jgi:hypothetical protein
MRFEGNKKALIELLRKVQFEALVGDDDAPPTKKEMRDRLQRIESLMYLIIISIEQNVLGENK